MAGTALRVPDRAEDIRPAYAFFGESVYEGRCFLEDLLRKLTEFKGGPPEVQTYNLADGRWGEILDAAKNISLFSPWRVFVVEGKGAGQEDLSRGEGADFAGYFASPAPKTAVVVLFEGRIHKTKPLGKALFALPEATARIVEFFPLKDKDLKPLVAEKFNAVGKKASPEAIERILDVSGGDIARIDSEVEKLRVYLGPRTTVEGEDVSALSSARSYQNWELNAALEAGDIDKALVIVDSMFENGEAAELILAVLSGFFRGAHLAKTELREGRDPKEVFRTAKPQITEKMGGFYHRMLGEYLALLGRIRDADLLRWLAKLEETDRRIKSTNNSPRELIQAFVIEYGKSAGRRVISPGRR